MILGILQARASSSRLPSKVLKPILGAPMLARQIERLKRCRRLAGLVLATSTDSSDDPVAAVASTAEIECYRGSLADVLDRLYRAAKPYRPSHVVRLTGDCPLADWTVIDRVVAFSIDGDYDYASNTLRPTWPDGLDVEICTFSSLETAWREATDPAEREHVTPFLYRRPERFRLGNLERHTDLARMRWTVDDARDLAFVTRVYEALYPVNPAFRTDDILALLCCEPEIAALNAPLRRNASVQAQDSP